MAAKNNLGCHLSANGLVSSSPHNLWPSSGLKYFACDMQGHQR